MNLIQDISLSSESVLAILDNSVLTWALIACGMAQLSKLFFELIFYQKLRFAVLLETGGMPSSHSSLVTATAAGVGLEFGFDNPVFALACTIAFIVMYDASGVRRSAGIIAARINELPVENWPSIPEKPLKESLGHSRIEVLIGALLGPAIAIPGIILVGSPMHVFSYFTSNLV